MRFNYLIKNIKIIFLIILMFSFFTSCDEEFGQTCENGRCSSQFEVSGTQYSIGDPSSSEIYMLELINRARSNPAAEGVFLTKTGNSDVNQSWGYFAAQNGSSFEESAAKLIEDFKKFKARPPIAFNEKLNNAAKVGAEMQRDNDIQDHVINGVGPDARITNAGYEWYSLGENIFANSKSALHGHAGFNIDWGNGPYGIQNPAGHRTTIMDSSYKEVGIYVLTENIPSSNHTAKGPQIISQDFASGGAGSNFITGVIYEDLNGNNFYDEGEGVQGITVSANKGSQYYAVTSTNGAYTIPISTNLGDVKVQAFSEDMEFVRQVKTVEIKNTNVKVDFKK